MTQAMTHHMRTWAAATAALLLTACGASTDDKGTTLTFKTVSIERTASIANEQNAPQCSVHMQIAVADDTGDGRSKTANEAIASWLLDIGGLTLQQAADSFANDYIASYRKDIAPLYRDDCSDAMKRAWYEYHYNISCETAPGRSGTTVYTANVDYYEGGAHGMNQCLVMNIDNKTGQGLSLSDVFTPGYSAALNRLLLEKLIQATGASDENELRKKGYLFATDMYATENFRLGHDAMTFIYNPYEIASYAEGLVKIDIDYNDLKELLSERFADE